MEEGWGKGKSRWGPAPEQPTFQDSGSKLCLQLSHPLKGLSGISFTSRLLQVPLLRCQLLL